MIIGQTFQIGDMWPYDCDCNDVYEYFYDPRKTPDYLYCDSIDTNEKGDCAAQFIASNGQNISKVFFRNSDMEKFPKDFILHDKVKLLKFVNCKMDEIPKRLIQSTCPSLENIWFYSSEIKSKTIPAGVFGNCKNLRGIDIGLRGIETVSKTAFSGLHKLRSLVFIKTALTHFEGFESIDNLEYLKLVYNNISTIEKDAFQGFEKLKNLDLSYNQLSTLEAGVFRGLEKLRYLELDYNQLSTVQEDVFAPFKNNMAIKIHLRGNPFHCNCSLKWLQDSHPTSKWFTNITIDDWDELQCSSPVKGRWKFFDICNVTTTESPKLQSRITVSSTVNNYTMPSPVTTNHSLYNFKHHNLTSYQSPTSILPNGLVLSTCIVAVAVILTALTVWMKIR